MAYPIPANDDAILAVRLLCAKIADAAIEGRRELEAHQKGSEAKADEETAEEMAAVSPDTDTSLVPVPEEAPLAQPELVAEEAL